MKFITLGFFMKFHDIFKTGLHRHFMKFLNGNILKWNSWKNYYKHNKCIQEGKSPSKEKIWINTWSLTQNNDWHIYKIEWTVNKKWLQHHLTYLHCWWATNSPISLEWEVFQNRTQPFPPPEIRLAPPPAEFPFLVSKKISLAMASPNSFCKYHHYFNLLRRLINSSFVKLSHGIAQKYFFHLN